MQSYLFFATRNILKKRVRLEYRIRKRTKDEKDFIQYIEVTKSLRLIIVITLNVLYTNAVHYFDHDQLLFFWFIRLEQDINWCVWARMHAHLLACLMPEIFVCLLCNGYR